MNSLLVCGTWRNGQQCDFMWADITAPISLACQSPAATVTPSDQMTKQSTGCKDSLSKYIDVSIAGELLLEHTFYRAVFARGHACTIGSASPRTRTFALGNRERASG